jgi:hypothetical protein
VEAYLQGRGLSLPDGAAGEAVRFHPCCPFAGERVPAMVCLVRDVVTNQPKAIHRTAMTRDGRKAVVNRPQPPLSWSCGRWCHQAQP